jgi:hypothetical protein
MKRRLYLEKGAAEFWYCDKQGALTFFNCDGPPANRRSARSFPIKSRIIPCKARASSFATLPPCALALKKLPSAITENQISAITAESRRKTLTQKRKDSRAQGIWDLAYQIWHITPT